ncbi:MAG TPA: hypothetical protein VLA12_15810 [Planctomycetaceae bacterium]|nr:hypothetical protein [Planctomycetaceae bacterium]
MNTTGDNTCFRWRDFVMTERDELAYSRALRELVPGILFYESSGRPKTRNRRVPNIPASTEWEVYLAIPSPDQMAAWSRNLVSDNMVVRPALYGHFQRSKWEWPDPTKKWAFDPPLISWGNVSFGFACDDDEIRRFADRIARCLSKITTHGKQRLGLDACLWSQSGGAQRRGLGPGYLIDPEERIELNKYYDDTLWDDRLPEVATGVRVDLP